MPNPDAPRRVSTRAGARGAQGAGAARAWQPTSSTAKKPPAGRPTTSNGKKPRVTRKGKQRYGFFNYPRKQYTGFRRWVPSWRFVVWSIIALGIIGIAGVAIAYSQVKIPQADEFVTAQKTTVYYGDGKSVMGTFGAQDRVLVNIDDLPDYVHQVFVAAEDRTFYENQGISPRGIARAFINNLRGGSQQGGSTITQQYAERYYLGETKSYTGKAKEALLAVKLAQHQDKDEILGNYMNTIYLGRGAYGIQSAARKYFGEDAADLTVSQAALIAGIVPSPTNWDPRHGDTDARRRWAYVLDGMVQLGWLTQTERDAEEFPETIEYSQTNTYGGTRGYLLDMVRTEMVTTVGLTEEELDTRGLRIVTTIDKKMQSQAVTTIKAMPEDTPKRLRESLITLDARSGAIRALYGGPNYLKQSYNNVTQGAAQAGSTFKPFALLAALEDGKSLTTDYYTGNNNAKVDGFTDPVHNFGNASYGYVNLFKATAESINTAYASLNVEIGPDKTMDAAIRAGIPKATAGLNDLPSNVLGTASVHPIDLATAYATIADGGVRHEAHIVHSVTELAGGEVYEAPTAGKDEFDPDVTANAIAAMEGVVKTGSGHTAGSLGRPVAGKTGTSSDNKSAWFAGFTPSLVTVVGLNQVGANGSEESITPFGGYSEITGGSVPCDVWTQYMEKVLEGTDIEEFPAPTAPTTPPKTEDDTDEGEVELDEPEIEQVRIPAGAVGSSEQDATTLLRDAGFKVRVTTRPSPEPKGTVLETEPGSGATVDIGTRVTIVVSSGPSEPVTPPDDSDGGGSGGSGNGSGEGSDGGEVPPPPDGGEVTPPPDDGDGGTTPPPGNGGTGDGSGAGSGSGTGSGTGDGSGSGSGGGQGKG